MTTRLLAAVVLLVGLASLASAQEPRSRYRIREAMLADGVGPDRGPLAVAKSNSAESVPADAEKSEWRGGEWYVKWGYNTAQYARTDIQFGQPRKSNDFTLRGVRMHDSRGWDIWNHALTVPQYSFRVGKFLRPNTAIEINFDHTKAIVSPDQSVRLNGTLDPLPRPRHRWRQGES